MNRTTTLLTSLALSTLGASCSSTTTSASTAVEPVVTPYEIATMNDQAFTVVLLRSAEGEMAPTKDQLARITPQHNAFVQDLVDEGYILSSGPFVPPRSDRSLRAMMIVDSSDAEEANGRCCVSPATEEGVFQMETIPFSTDFDIRSIADAQKAFEMERGDVMNSMRPYVVVVAPSSSAFDAMAAQMGDVIVFTGQCAGGSFDGMTLCVMNCATVDEASQFMSVMGSESTSFEYHPWISTAALAEMN